MSVATEFTPSVPIPPQARAARHLHALSPGLLDVPAPEHLGSVSVLRAPRQASAAPPVRLTRRGVLVLSLVVAALGITLAWVAALSAPDSAPAPRSAPAAVTVRSGDTLWSIAGRVAPQHDPRAEVATLQRLNHLRGVDLVPGQQLRLR